MWQNFQPASLRTSWWVTRCIIRKKMDAFRDHIALFLNYHSIYSSACRNRHQGGGVFWPFSCSLLRRFLDCPPQKKQYVLPCKFLQFSLRWGGWVAMLRLLAYVFGFCIELINPRINHSYQETKKFLLVLLQKVQHLLWQVAPRLLWKMSETMEPSWWVSFMITWMVAVQSNRI